MKLLLLLLLLPLCALSFFAFENDEKTIKGKIGGLRKKFGRISKENKAKLAKSLGQDPEERKSRLQKLFARKVNRTMTDEERQQLQERITKIRTVKTEKPIEDEPVDLFEVNEKEGVAEYLFQGDLLLTNAQLDELEHDLADAADPIRAKRQATTVYSKWTGNTVYYYFDSSLNQRKRNSVAAAIDYLESRTCLKFVYSTTATNRIRVFDGVGCYSYVGMLGGEQELSLGDGCEVIGTVAHEFAHALGIWHMQMRSDRDNYVTIDLSNVQAGLEYNFDKLSLSGNILYTPYEYGSFMHYPAYAFAKDYGRLTIIPKDPRFAYTMGNRQISFLDIKMINEFYGCNATCPAATSAQCQNGGYPNPKNCATCNCPLGYELKCDKKLNTFTIEYRYIQSNGPAPTTKAPVPKTTSTAPGISRLCVDMTNSCAMYMGYCTIANSTTAPYAFQSVKWACGKTCGLCGKKANPCIDYSTHIGDFPKKPWGYNARPISSEQSSKGPSDSVFQIC